MSFLIVPKTKRGKRMFFQAFSFGLLVCGIVSIAFGYLTLKAHFP